MRLNRAAAASLLLLLLAGLLCGCAIPWPIQTGPEPTAEPTPEPTPYRGEETMDLSEKSFSELQSELPELYDLRHAVLAPDSLTPEELRQLEELRPDVSFEYRFHVYGAEYGMDLSTLDLTAAGNETLELWFRWAGCMQGLRRIELGEGEASDGRIPWAALAALRAQRPDLSVDYSFTLYDKSFTLDSEEMNLNHIAMDDQGALVKAVALCMPNLSFLDMDTCEVDDEHMAEIRDALPRTEVVWRIWFGEHSYATAGYSVRTNVERILASNPGIGGDLTPENTRSLKYCTKVKYLDLGHNPLMRDIDFVRYMPDLEAVVLAMGSWFDASPLENCPKLRYAELQTTALADVRPLTKLKNLTDLNICYCFALHDISPLYEMTQLKRLWIGCMTPVLAEQVARMRVLNPTCEIDTEVIDPTTGTWRFLGYDEYGIGHYSEAYAWLREVMHYAEAPDSYSYFYNDPLYYGQYQWW